MVKPQAVGTIQYIAWLILNDRVQPSSIAGVWVVDINNLTCKDQLPAGRQGSYRRCALGGTLSFGLCGGGLLWCTPVRLDIYPWIATGFCRQFLSNTGFNRQVRRGVRTWFGSISVGVTHCDSPLARS